MGLDFYKKVGDVFCFWCKVVKGNRWVMYVWVMSYILRRGMLEWVLFCLCFLIRSVLKGIVVVRVLILVLVRGILEIGIFRIYWVLRIYCLFCWVYLDFYGLINILVMYGIVF